MSKTTDGPQLLGANITATYPSNRERSVQPTPAERRLEASFQAFCSRTGRQRRWTPELRAEVWALFANECQQLRKESGIPVIFKNIDLEALSPRLPAGYLEVARILLDVLEKPQAITVNGIRGTGKTALASGLVNAFINCGRPARYCTAREYFDGLTGMDWQAKDSYRKPFYGVDLLVIDEVQVRDAREWQDNELTTLIDVRHRSEKSTLLLSNLEPGALKENLGDSIWRRIIETGGPPIETAWTRLAEWNQMLRDQAEKK